LPVAIGDISGEADFNVSTQQVLSSLLPASATGVAEYVGLKRTRSVRVRELSLQAFYEGAPDYLEVLAWLRRRGFAPVDLDPGAMHDALLAEVDCLLRRTA
jgi:hypothetical protein